MSNANYSHAEIKKSRSKTNPFKVLLVADNGEILMTSELLTTRRNCIKNLIAVMKVVLGERVIIKDYTGKKMKETQLDVDGLEKEVS